MRPAGVRQVLVYGRNPWAEWIARVMVCCRDILVEAVGYTRQLYLHDFLRITARVRDRLQGGTRIMALWFSYPGDMTTDARQHTARSGVPGCLLSAF